ncbi:MAG: tetratricopeptide repeat protein, partial [Candidatus Parcubacteria bacterium]|nr:tetratricopeptide repeat protein [Burkholderiales bacterium]
MNWLARVLGIGPDPAAPSSDAREEGHDAYSLGLAADAEQRGEEAVALFRRAVASAPGNADYRCALGTALFRGGHSREAANAFRAGLEIDAGHDLLRLNLAMALLVLEDYEAALDELLRLQAQGSRQPRLLPTLGYVQCQLGDVNSGIAALRRALAAEPENAETHRNLLLAMNYSAELGAAEIAAEHRRFGNRHEQPVGEAPIDSAWPRRLRIGYVSPDFRSHVVASFMLPVLSRHDRSRYEVFCYYTNKTEDEVTARLRALSEHWRECAALNKMELSSRIRADRVDILVDLAGHTGKSRLKTFALKPAPVQMTYLGYPNTTGLRAIDFRITDARADPPGEADALNTERLLRLPRTFLCYRPDPDVVPVAPLPALRTGTVTFGCFNNFQKLSAPFLAATALILHATPGSRLLLKARPLGIARVAADTRRRYVELGVEPGRVTLRGWEASVENHLAAYQEVDIALDSFPYNGTTTTCEAFWMGVPVVTLCGDRHAARVGASLLHAVGLEDLVARGLDDLVRIASQLAADLPRLAGLRETMRGRMRQSPLMDETGFVSALEAAYAQVWQAKLAAPAPASPDEAALTRLWDESHESGEHAAAIEALGRAIAADGAVARHHYMLGCTLQDAGRPAEAMAAYRQALTLSPGLAKAHNNLGCLQEAGGDGEAALQSYDAAARADPGLASALYNRGNLHKARGDAAQAQSDLDKALAIEPQHADWRCVLGEVQVMQGRPDAAVASFNAVLASDPSEARARFGLGNAFLFMGRADEAEASFRAALDQEPDFAGAHSNLLLAMHYRKGDDPKVMFEAHLEWARRHAGGLPHAPHASPSPAMGRKLNVGYVSPNFQHHAVAWATEPVLAAHDRSRVRMFFYSTAAKPDAVTQRFMKLCDQWRDIHATSDEEAARLVRQDRIDILVDLAGHTGGGRPLLFARKPAPVQVNWQGYPNTTGLAQVDYRITDAHADPEGEADRHHTERLVRLPSGFFCYAPPLDAPAEGEPPMLASGRVTFGCFNNLAKVTPEMIVLWSQILAGLPGARLIMKAHALASQDARRVLRAHFAAAGVAQDRVELFGPEDSHDAHMGRYREIDIALDPFPYHGTATTCEALWMGVPVVTLAGRTHLSRVGVSVLKRLTLDELIADTREQYVSKAI